MDSKKTTSGFIKIDNALFDAIMSANFTKLERKIIDAIIRLTIGYNKQSAVITTRKIAQMTQSSQPHIAHNLSKLIKNNVVIIAGEYHFRLLQLNNNYTNWKLLKDQKTPITQVHSDTESVSTNTKKQSLLIPKAYRGLYGKRIDVDTESVSLLIPKTYHYKDKLKDNLKNNSKNIRPQKPKKNKTQDIKTDLALENNHQNKPSVKKLTKPTQKTMLPDWLNIDLFEKYVENRIFIKSPMSEYAKHLAINKLKKLIHEGEDQTELITHAIESNWKSFYPSKQNQGIPGNGKQTRQKFKSVTENVNEKLDQYIREGIDNKQNVAETLDCCDIKKT